MEQQEANVNDITRLEVIDYRDDSEDPKRRFIGTDLKLDISIQDEGRTLKIFVWDKGTQLFYNKEGHLRAAVRSAD